MRQAKIACSEVQGMLGDNEATVGGCRMALQKAPAADGGPYKSVDLGDNAAVEQKAGLGPGRYRIRS